MTRHSAKARIRAFVAERFPQAEFDDDEDIFELGFVNSLFAMELVLFIEDTIQVVIPNEELTLDNFRTVQAMASLAERLAGPQSPSPA